MSNDDDDDLDLSDSKRQKVCVECAKLSPPTDSSFTLISSRYGWRLARAVDADGKPVVAWRCPECWARLKGRTAPVAKKG